MEWAEMETAARSHGHDIPSIYQRRYQNTILRWIELLNLK
jgi:hypothetical protein